MFSMTRISKIRKCPKLPQLTVTKKSHLDIAQVFHCHYTLLCKNMYIRQVYFYSLHSDHTFAAHIRLHRCKFSHRLEILVYIYM